MRDEFSKRDQFALKTKPLGGIGTTVVYGYGGTGISARKRRATAIPKLPFKLLDASNVANPSTIRVVAGTLSASAFGWSTVPTGMTPGDTTKFYVSAPAPSGYVYIKVLTAISGVPTISDVTVEAAATVPVTSTNATFSTGYQSLGTYAVTTNGTFNKTKSISAGGDLAYLYCNGHYFWGTTVED